MTSGIAQTAAQPRTRTSRKAKAADKMFTDLVSYMNDSLAVDRGVNFSKKEKVPSWL